MNPRSRPAATALAMTLALLGAGCGGGGAAPAPLPATACAPNYDFGYTDRQSYLAGEVVTAYLQGKQAAPACRLDVYDVLGGRAFSVAAALAVQPATQRDPSVDGFGLAATLRFALPADLASGVYLIEGQSPFVVKRSDALDLLVVYPSNTANAYATSGGKSLYTSPVPPAAVSFLRPVALAPRSMQCLSFFAALQGLQVGYAVDADLDDYATVAQARMLAIAGHSEYWTRAARQSFDRFVDAGGHALVLSGNTMWWQVRYSADRTQLVCHKQGPDPEPDPLLQTSTWNSRALRYPILASIGADFPRGGYGRKADAGWDGYRIAAADSPLLEGTGLRRGDILRLSTSEYDGAPIRGFDAEGYPVLDPGGTPFGRMELIGFDKGSRFDVETVGTFIVMQRHAAAGTIVNAASNDWCSDNGMGGPDGAKLQRITRNAVFKLLRGQSLFSPAAGR